MLVQVPDVLTPDQVAECRRLIDSAQWVDGRVTAGFQSEKVKHNMQVPEGHPAARQAGAMVLAALDRNPMVLSAGLPLKIFPPLFNRYAGGQNFGNHVDNAIRAVPGTPHRVRTDISCTLFLTPPEDYDGGELLIDDTYGAHKVKLPAGHMVMYPSTSLHRVQPVTRGARVSSFFWIQSMVRDDGQRTLLFDLDVAIQQVTSAAPDSPAVVQLTGVYHNLLRRWADS